MDEAGPINADDTGALVVLSSSKPKWYEVQMNASKKRDEWLKRGLQITGSSTVLVALANFEKLPFTEELSNGLLVASDVITSVLEAESQHESLRRMFVSLTLRLRSSRLT